MRPLFARRDPIVRLALRPSFVALVATLVVGAAAPGPLRAQAPVSTDATRDTVPLLGGAAGLLTAAGLEPTRPRATVLLDVIHIIHEVRPAMVAATDERRDRVLAYLDTIAQFQRARAAFPGDTVAFPTGAAGATRKQLEAFAAAVGAALEAHGREYRIRLVASAREQERRAWLLAAGVDVEKIAAGLNAGTPVAAALQSDEVPLPLPEAAWRPLSGLLKKWPSHLAGSIVADRSAALLYFGLCSMDDETRAYLAANPSVVGDLHGSDRAAVVALYGRSLHVRRGAVEPPGGPAAAALWESVAGRPLARPDEFILAVLGKDGGRLALLYDAVAHMDAPHQAFVLGSWLGDPVRQAARFKALYSVCADGLKGWEPALRPFARGLYDPAEVLLLAGVSPDGRPGPLPWRTLWQRAFDGERLPARPEEELKDLDKGGVLDAAGLLETVQTVNNRARRELSEAYLFGQRVFASAPTAKLPQVLVALRGFGRYRALALTLERLGITEPDAYADAMARAQEIIANGDRDRAATALSLFQGALALVERARVARTIDAVRAGGLVRSLSLLPFAGGEFAGSVAGWIESEYLRAVGGSMAPAGTSGAATVEAQVLSAFAGQRPNAPPPDRILDFEGTRYRVDPAAPELARLLAVREKQGGATLDEALAFERAVRGLAGAGSVARVAAEVEALKSAAPPLVQAQRSVTSGWSRGFDLGGQLAEALDALGGIRVAEDLSKIDRIAAPLRRAADRELGRVLASLAYAASLGDPAGTALVAGDPSLEHDWRLNDIDENIRARGAWSLPDESHDYGTRWHVQGALLALDLGLGSQAFRRLSTDAPPAPPTVSDNDRRAFTEAAVMANAFDYRDADMARLAEALVRGRARLAEIAADPARLRELAGEAALDETRQNLLAWSAVHEPERVPGFFSLGDLLRLGGLSADSIEALDAWGTSGLSYDGRLRLRFPATQPFATLAGRAAKGVLATLLPDLALLVAESLSQQRLPAALARSVLGVATLDFMDRLSLAYDEDWLTLVSDVQRILPARMDDYLASATTSGPLVPLPRGPDAARQ
jgi:hypothetical protein